MHSHQNKNRGNCVDGKQCIEQFSVKKAEQIEYIVELLFEDILT